MDKKTKKENKKEFLIAARDGNVPVMYAMLLAGQDPNVKYAFGDTALIIATRENNIEVINLLLAVDTIDPNIINKFDDSALYIATIGNQIEAAKALLSNQKIDLNVKYRQGNTVLVRALLQGYLEMAELLLSDEKTDQNIENKSGYTPLMYAAGIKTTHENKHSQINVIKMLIAHGAKLSAMNKYGQTAYDLAQAQGNNEVINLLKEEQAPAEKLAELLDIELSDSFDEALAVVENFNEEEIESSSFDSEFKGYALKLKQQINKQLFRSVITDEAEEIAILLNFGANVNAQDENGNTPLLKAVSNAHYEIVKLLLKRKADPNIANQTESTPLIQAAAILNIMPEAELELIKIATILIENKANVNAVDDNGNSALLFATMALSDKMVKLLLKHKAEQNLWDSNYLTPLMYAAKERTTSENRQRQINIINLLIEYGAKLFTTNSDGETAYDIAVQKDNTEVAEILKVKELMQILQRKNPPALFYETLPIVETYNEQEIKNLEADSELINYALKLKNNMNKKLFDQTISKKQQLKVLLDFGADVNAQDENGNTPLSKAVSNVDYEIVKLLLQRKADPNITNQRGSTPLVEAAITLKTRPGAELELIKIAIILIENNANVNAVDQYGNNALLYAVIAPSDKMVKLLLKHNAEANIENCNYLTPLMYAAKERTADENRQHQINIVNLLIEYGAKLFATNYYGETAYDLAALQENNEIGDILKDAMQKRGKEIYGLRNIAKNS